MPSARKSSASWRTHAMTDAIANLVPLLATVLLHFLWQGVLVGVLAWMLLSVLHAARPQARYLVACLALVACVVLPLLTFAKLALVAGPGAGTILLAGSQGALAPPATDPVATAILAAPSHAALRWIVSVWAAGAGALCLR